MDPVHAIAARHGFFTRADVRELGYDDRAVARAIGSGLWHRFRRGTYTFTETWAGLDEVARHRLRCAAVMRSLGPGVALSHVSGAIHHGIDVWGVDLSRVHVTRLDGVAGRIEGDVVHHEGLCLREEVHVVRGLRVLSADRCVLEAGSRVGGEAALVMLNSLLHRGLCSSEALRAQFEILQHWPFMQRMQIPLRLADPGSASVGESRGLWLFWCHRLPRPVTQFEVRDAGDGLLGTTDWAWPDQQGLGEFDGALKYGRVLRPGQDPGDVVFAEKQREDRLREETGMWMVRLVWSDFQRPAVTAARIRRLMRISA